MRVLKFGGSSIGSPENIKKVKKIVMSQKQPIVVVISAIQGITDQLLRISALATKKDSVYKEQLSKIQKQHLSFIEELEINSIAPYINKHINSLTEILNGVYLLGDITPKIQDKILSFGELLSSAIVCEYFGCSELLESDKLIATDKNYGKAKVDFVVTYKNIKTKLNKKKGVFVAPGFIGSDTDKNITTLGRGGSDFSAAIFASALNAEILEIWTDVDGFLTADPKEVSKAFAIETLSYSEAMELSHFGAEVIYSPTIQPVFQKKIPIAIKNTFNPDSPGTLIIDDPELKSEAPPIKGISSIEDINLITIQGPGMVGVRGISSRLFGSLANSKVNIILITQASSEYSISFAVSPKDTDIAVSSIEKEFDVEINNRNEINLRVERDLSIIAIVGEQMKNTPGISATLFQSLGRNGISVIATAQGSSELNISIVIKKESLKKALNVIHEGFFLSNYKELHLFLVGIGTVGSSLISQIKQQQEHLLKEHRLKINVVGICRSRKMVVNEEGINLDNYLEEIENGETVDHAKFVKYIAELNLRNSVFVDCTASNDVSDLYLNVLDSYASVVTANKVACSSDYELYRKLKKTALKNNVKFMYETNVGAGLPIINTINDLSRSGDKILKLEAVLSGTLNFIFNELSENITLSRAIELAKEKGFSEPDPRIDLSGIDVVRKLIILGREAGYKLDQKDIKIEPFLPKDCFEGSLDDFWKNVAKYNVQFEEQRKELSKKGLKWRFIASLDHGNAKVSLQTVDMLHPAYPLEGSNNILLLTTERYNDAPMVIRGYGAGADVTAAGVFADIIRVANV